jgi:mannose-6-phosphate isomerase-like protein (cupin superfamily)
VISKTEKPWGYEKLLELNENYVLKKLFMKKNHQCSLQYHEFKHETLYIISGTLRLTVGNDIKDTEEVELHSNDFYVLPPMKIHRMFGITDCIYLEASTPQLDDVVRLKDDYNRIG